MKKNARLLFACLSSCLFLSLSAQTSISYRLNQAGTFSPVTVAGSYVGLSDESYSSALPIGFSFAFFDSSYTDFYISSNGFISFSSTGGTGCCSGQSLPDVTAPNNLIAFAWNDLDPGAGGAIYYQTIGSAPNRRLVISFLAIPHYGSFNTPVTSQISLFEGSNIIEIHSTSIPALSGLHTMGIENKDGTMGLAVPGRNASTWFASSDYVQFVPFQHFTNDAGIKRVSLSSLCAGTQTVSATLKNFGTNQISSLQIGWEINGVLQTPVSYSSILDTLGGQGSDTALLQLGSLSLVQGQSYALRAWTYSPNMLSDPHPANDTSARAFSTGLASTSYTIGGSNPDYASWQAAVSDLNTFGVCGPVVFNIRSGTYNENIVIHDIAGTSPINTVTFQSESGDSSDVILSSTATSMNPQTVKLLGSKYVTFRALSIKNTAANSSGMVVVLENGASYNRFLNNVLEASATNQTNPQISVVYASAGNDPTDNANGNRFQQNRILHGAYGFFAHGYSSLSGEKAFGNKLINNEFSHSFASAITATNQDSLLIRANQIESLNHSISSIGIDLSFCGDEIHIHHNQLRLGKGTGISLGQISGSSDFPLVAHNNFISLLDSASEGIKLFGCNFSTLAFNNVHISGGSSTSAGIALYSENAYVEVKNNIFANSAGGYALSDDMSSGVALDFNNYFSSGPFLAFQSTGIAHLPDWQLAYGQDSNSLEVNPAFHSHTDLHVRKALLNSAGTFVSGIFTDIDNETRGTPPDIGADEFQPSSSYDASISDLLYPSSPFSAGTYPLYAVLKNVGVNTLAGLTIKWSVNGTNQSNIIWSGNLATGQSDTISLGNVNFLSGLGYDLTSWVELPSGQVDIDPSDDTLSVLGLRTALAGLYTIGGSNPDFSDFSAAVQAMNQAGVSAAVTFLVRSGTYHEQISIPEFAGSSCQTPILFRSESDDSSQVILTYDSQDFFQNYVLQLKGADGITFRSMTIKATDSLFYLNNRLVDIREGASCNTFDKVHFWGVPTTSPGWTEALVYANEGSLLDSNNSFQNSIFDYGSIGICISGLNLTYYEKGNAVLHNSFRNQYFQAIYFESQDGLLIKGNDISSLNAYSSNFSGINGSFSSGAFRIEKNDIQAATGYGLYLYVASGSSGSKAQIVNNFISVGGTTTAYGIFVSSSDYLDILHNSVHVYSTDSLNGRAFFNPSFSTDHRISNNIFANSGRGYAIYLLRPTYADADHNDLFSNGLKLGYYNGFDHANITSWINATQEDSNSVSIYPDFVSDTDLHVQTIAMEGLASPLAQVTEDIDGDIRNLTAPDMGADEFTIQPNDVGIVQILSPKTACNLGSADSVRVRIQNFDNVPHTAFNVAFSLNGQTAVVENVGSLSIAGGQKADFTFKTATVDLSTIGSYSIQAYTQLTGDQYPANDSLAITFNNFPPFQMSISGDSSLCEGASTLLTASTGGNAYTWANGTQGRFNQVTPTSSQTFRLSATNLNGCTAVDSFYVEVKPSPTKPSITASASLDICTGDTLVLSASPGSNIYWNTGDSSSSITVSASGAFWLSHYSTLNNCETHSDTAVVSISKEGISSSGLTTICQGNSITLSASNAATASWSDGSSTNTISVSPGSTTSYHVNAVTPGGCSYSDSVLITVTPAIQPGAITNPFPSDNAVNQTLPLRLSWLPGNNALLYDVYVWEKGSGKPVFPNSENQSRIDFNPLSLSYFTSYYWQVVSKSACLTTSSDTFEFKTRGLPDLLIDSTSLPASGTASQNITLSWTVKNQGIEGTGSTTWNDFVWLSSDDNLRASEDILLGKKVNVSFLNPGQSYIQTATFQLPRNLSGSYFLFISTDNSDAYCATPNQQCFVGAPRASSASSLLEKNEGNNWIMDTILIQTAPVPDLKMLSVGAPSAAFSGDNITLTYQVKNAGNIPAFRPWRDIAFLSPDSILNLQNATLLKTHLFTTGQLDPDSSYTYTLSGRIPYSFMGPYFAHILTDGSNHIYEGAFEGNNLGTATIPVQVTLTPPPDLVPTAISAQLSVLQTEQKLKVDWTVENQGFNAPAVANWRDRIYISLVDTFNPNLSINLGEVFYTQGTSLKNGDDYSQSLTFSLAKNLQGPFYVYVFTDVANEVFEFNQEANNIRRSAQPINISLFPYADLIVSNITVSADSMYGGNSYALSWTIKNQGIASIPSGWHDRLSLSSVPSNSSPVVGMGDFAHSGGLAAGDSVRIHANIVAPNFSGLWYFNVETDIHKKHYEYIFESNNRSVLTAFGGNATLFIPTSSGGPQLLADLAATGLSASDTVSSGDAVAFDLSAKNLGPASLDLGKFYWNDAIYLSSDTIWDPSDQKLGSRGIYLGLDSGDTYSNKLHAGIPFGWGGKNYFLYVLDESMGVARDTIRQNNVLAREVYIHQLSPPDLTISQTHFPDTLFASQLADLAYEVDNKGAVSIKGNQSWSDFVYLSNTPDLSSVIGLIGTKRKTGPLAGNASYSDTIRARVPSYLSGNYYLLLRTNAKASVYEDSTQNNLAAVPVQILPIHIYSGDLVVSEVHFPDSILLGMKDTIRFELKNIGPRTLTGIPRNAAYFSLDSIFDGAADPLFSYAETSLNLAAGDSITGEIRGISKGINPGNYRGILRANTTNSMPESNFSNNEKINGRVNIDAQALTVNIPDTTDLKIGDYRYYKVDVAAGLDLLISLKSNQSSGVNEVWVAYGKTPGSSHFDFKNQYRLGTDQIVLVPNTQAGTYYILVETQTVFSSTQEVEILARTLPFSILSITSNKVGQGKVSTRLAGAGFKTGLRIELRDSMAHVVATAGIKSYISSMELILKWDLSQVALGIYDVVAVNPNGDEVSLVKGLEVEVATELEMAVFDSSPNAIRHGRQAVFNYVFQNTGNVDVPYAKAEIGFLKASNLVSLQTAGDVYKLTDLIDTTVFESDDWVELNIYKFIPLLAKDLEPGEQFFATATFEHFVYSDFPIRARVVSYTTELFVDNQQKVAESHRQFILSNEDSLAAYPDVLAVANDPQAFRDSIFQLYFDLGIMDSAEVAGISLAACLSCGNEYEFSPGFSPGMQTLNDTVLGPGATYLWEINHPEGTVGRNPGWDFLRIKGRLDITASASDPFHILMASLSSYTNQTGFLTGWSPGYDISWPIIAASGGIHGFDTSKVKLDPSRFTALNDLHGGFFYLQQVGTDSIFLRFQARIPAIGQNGIPGGPGQPGQAGGRGGPGGAGDASTPPGKGGKGGKGGIGVPEDLSFDGQEVPAGPGGEGGKGGEGGPGQAGGAGGQGGTGGQSGPGQTGGAGGKGGSGGEGGSNGGGGTGGDGGKGGDGDTGGPGGDKGPGGPSGGGSGAPGSDGNLGDGGTSGNAYSPENSNGGFNYSNSGGNSGAGIGGPGLGPVRCSNDKTESTKKCQDFWQYVGCYTTLVSCTKDIIKYTGAGAIAGAGWGGVLGAGYASFKCAISVYNCKTGGNKVTNAIGCATGIGDVITGDPSGALGCGGYTCELIPVVRSCDPNEIVGPPGYETDHWVSVKDNLDYTIFYENDPVFANAPAQRVTVRQEVDADLNLASFSLGEFGFRNMTFQVPANRSSYSTVLRLKDSIGVDVEVTAGLDIVNREIFWVFQSIDPATGLPPYDPFAGYLPVNDSFGIGEGFVTYFIKARTSSQTGDSISAFASIVFDINDPLLTNTYVNLVDAFAPASELDSILMKNDSTFCLSVHAQDDSGGVGAAAYDLYVSENNGAYSLLTAGIAIDSSYLFVGNQASTYCFFSRSIDWVKNQEPLKAQSDSCLTVLAAKLISLLQPNGGDSYCTGDSLTASWSARGIDSVNLYYSADSGQNYIALEVGRNATDSVFHWLLPDSLPSSASYFLKVESQKEAMLFAKNELPFKVSKRPDAPVLTSPQGPFCLGDTVSLHGPANMAAYHWSNQDTTQSIQLTQSGSYTLSIKNSEGCQSLISNTLSVTVHALPAQATITGNLAFCQGDSSQLAAPAGFAGYLWSNGQTDSLISVRAAQSLTVVVTDSNGCESPLSNAANVTVHALPNPIILPGDSIFCDGESLVLRTQQQYPFYTWSDGSTADSLLVSQSGTYALSVIDSNMCEGHATDSVSITVLAIPARPGILKIGTDSLMASTQGTSYQWFINGNLIAPTSQTILYMQNGHYSVIVFNGPCESAESDSLLINTALDDLLDGVAVSLYPNPNSGIFEIRADFKGNTFVDAQIFTPDGKSLYNKYLHAPQGRLREQVYLPHLAAGIYLLRLRVNDDYVIRKWEVLR